MFEIPCVILSGGKSSRMGEDKTFLSFLNSRTLIDFQVNKLSQLFKRVYISCKENKFNEPYNLILDTSSIYSPMIALKTILEELKEDKVFIITIDAPFLSETTIKDICKNKNLYDIVIAKNGDKVHNLLGIFSSSCLDNITQYIQSDNHKISHLIKNSNSKIMEFENKNEFLNINTKKDYQKALDILIV
jgi:molybdopterin-guanine dinucleotide biosynthesis protein A